MIDLSMLEQKTFDVKLQDGTLVNIRKPSNELFKEVLKMGKVIESNNDSKINGIYTFLTKMFNRNTNNLKFTQSELENKIDFDIAVILIIKFRDFLEEIMADINF